MGEPAKASGESASTPVKGTERGNPVLQMAAGFWTPRCLHVIAELGIADHLDDTPRTAAALAEAVGANADAVNRILRLLAAHGIFAAENGTYSHTEASRALRSDHPRSVRAYVRMLGAPMSWQSWAALEHCARTGQASTETVFPGGMFAYFREHPTASRVFDEAMMAKSHGDMAAILPAYDFSGFKVIADIGGGRGHLLRAILEANPSAKGIIFDQPHVVADAAASGRLTTIGGDFFKDELPKADAYLLMNVIHDWADEESHAILSATRRAAPPHAKLLVIETVLPDSPGPHWSKFLDINMLTLGGRERTLAEYETLFARAGFRLTRKIDTASPYSIVEAVPI